MSPSDHKISAYVLLKSDKIELLKTKLGALLYVVNIHRLLHRYVYHMVDLT
jgi:hypothetical protein